MQRKGKENKMDYMSLLRDSFHLFTRNKQLWLFGILMSLFGAGGYRFNVNYRESINNTGSTPDTQDFESLFPGASLLVKILQNPALFIALAIAVSTLSWLITQAIASWCRAAIVSGVKLAEVSQPVSFREAASSGSKQFPSVYALSLLLSLPGLLMTFSSVVAVGLLFYQLFNLSQQSNTQMLAFFMAVFGSMCAVICIGGILAFVFNLLAVFAVRANILEKLSFVDSLRTGWSLLSKHLGPALLIAIGLWLVAVVFGWIVALPALAMWVPVAQALLHNQWTSLAIILGVIFVGYYLVFSVILGGTLTSFNEMLWTRFYLNLMTPVENVSSAQPQIIPEA